MKTSIPSLIQVLTDIKRHTFVELEYTTAVNVRKKGNTKFIEYPVTKHTKTNVSFNGSYQNSVNNRLDKKDIERTFISEPLPWGMWKLYPKLIEHKENVYARFYIHKNSTFDNVFEYNGKVVSGADLYELYQFLPPIQESPRQTEAGLEIDEQCKPLTININNINSLTINKIKY